MGQRVEADSLRRDVGALAAMRRGSAGAGERGSAEWVRARLAEAGAADPALEHFPFQPSYGQAHALHFAAGVLAAVRGGHAGAALALASLASFEREFSGRSQWVRRLLPAREGTNVVARVPGRGPCHRTLVLVAHHDAARTGLIWHPRVMSPVARRADRTGRVRSFATLPALGFALVAAGAALRTRPAGTSRGAAGTSRGAAPARARAVTASPSRHSAVARLAGGLRAAGGALLTLGTGLSLEVARGEVVPGAFDNASGVAALLALAHRLARDPLDGVEVVLLATGCEESGMGGMRAWLERHGDSPDPAATLVVGLDGLGAGQAVVLSGEGGVLEKRYRPADIAWADRGAAVAGVSPPRRWRIGGWSDPVIARMADLPALCLMSVRDGGFPNYHLPSDTPEGIDWVALERDVRLAAGIAEAFARG